MLKLFYKYYVERRKKILNPNAAEERGEEFRFNMSEPDAEYRQLIDGLAKSGEWTFESLEEVIGPYGGGPNIQKEIGFYTNDEGVLFAPDGKVVKDVRTNEPIITDDIEKYNPLNLDDMRLVSTYIDAALSYNDLEKLDHTFLDKAKLILENFVPNSPEQKRDVDADMHFIAEVESHFLSASNSSDPEVIDITERTISLTSSNSHVIQPTDRLSYAYCKKDF
jgi:hypothetical protein